MHRNVVSRFAACFVSHRAGRPFSCFCNMCFIPCNEVCYIVALCVFCSCRSPVFFFLLCPFLSRFVSMLFAHFKARSAICVRSPAPTGLYSPARLAFGVLQAGRDRIGCRATPVPPGPGNRFPWLRACGEFPRLPTLMLKCWCRCWR